MNPAQITVVGAGSQLIPVNVPAWFEIRGAVACEDGELVVNITCKSAIICIFISPKTGSKETNKNKYTARDSNTIHLINFYSPRKQHIQFVLKKRGAELLQ